MMNDNHPLPEVYCPCGRLTHLVKGSDIGAPHLDMEKPFWKCDPCNAWVGCHPDSNFKPTGIVANKDLRFARGEAHKALGLMTDYIAQKHGLAWRDARASAYSFLSKKMMMPRADCHISWFDVALCFDCKKICEEFLKEKEPQI